jgi:LCP family protein required for cell wall assembly
LKKKRSAGKIIGIVLICLCILLLLLMLAAFIYFNSLLGKIDRTEITGDLNLSEEEIYETPTVDVPDSIDEIEQVKQEFEAAQKIDIVQSDGVENILLIGADRRSMQENGRSDSVILVSLNHETGKIHLTSFMRAMYVCIPRSDGNVWGMLNAAYSWGGPNLLIDTIELNFRVRIDRYVIVDFTAFKTAIDMVGGVEVNLSEAEAKQIKIESKKFYNKIVQSK